MERPWTRTLPGELAALPPLPSVPRTALAPIAQRGARKPMRNLGEVLVQVRRRPHGGWYADAMPDINPDDDACGMALAFGRIMQAADRADLAAVLGRQPRALATSTDGGAQPSDEAYQLAQGWGQKADPAALFAAALLVRAHGARQYKRDHAGWAAANTQRVTLLRRVEAALPVDDLLGGLARLELVFALSDGGEREQASKAFTALLQAPLRWATVGALLQIAQYQYQHGEGGDGYEAFVVAASGPSDPVTRAAARAFSTRIAVEEHQTKAAFGHASLLVNDPVVAAALAPERIAPFITAAGRAVADLPEAWFDLLAAWPAPWAGKVAAEASQYVYTSARAARLGAIAARYGQVPPARSSPPDLEDESALTSLVNHCALVANRDPAPFDLTVVVFEKGPPEVAVRGSIPFEACLRENAEAYFGGSRPSVRARVSVLPI
jgi:hypothetical protein